MSVDDIRVKSRSRGVNNEESNRDRFISYRDFIHRWIRGHGPNEQDDENANESRLRVSDASGRYVDEAREVPEVRDGFATNEDGGRGRAARD